MEMPSLARTVATVGTITATLLPSLVPSAFAYPPPCKRGDLYIGAETYEDAHCTERKFLRMERALEKQAENIQRRVFMGETTRTMNRNVRKVYLHPTNKRFIEKESIAERNIRERRLPVDVREQSVHFPLTKGTKQAAQVRQDTSREAKLSFRTKRAMVKKMHRQSPKQKTR